MADKDQQIQTLKSLLDKCVPFIQEARASLPDNDQGDYYDRYWRALLVDIYAALRA